MKADPKAQLQLLRLAELDAELNRIKHTAQTLPQHAEIDRLSKERVAISDELTAATTHADDLGIAARRAENDLVPVKERLRKDQERVDGGSVTDQKTLRGLIDEIEHLKGRISDLEDVQLEAMGQHEEAVAHRDRLAARKQEIETEMRSLLAARDEAGAGLQEEAKAVVASRGAMVKTLPEPLVKLYERLRAQNGSGAGQLMGSRCGGCRLELNVSDVTTIRQAPRDEVVRCPECSRILVRTET